MNTEELIQFIKNSRSFDEVRSAEVLPEPDQDDGFYFISYSHKDYKAVLPDIVNYVDFGLQIWYDRFLESGKSWATEVHKKIASYYCKGVILYITKNFLQSASCLEEVNCVFENNKSCAFVLIGVTLDELSDTVLDKLGISFSTRRGKIEILDYGDATADKAAVITSLEKPELFEYYFNEGTRVLKIFNSRRMALVKKVNCNDMRKVELPGYVMHDGKKYRMGGIMYSAFQNNSMLEEVTVPDGWALLMAGAFTRCKSLHTVNLGTPKLAGILKVGALMNVFVDCPNLSEINKSKGLILLSGTFRNSQSIKRFNSRGYVLSNKSFSGCVNLEDATLSPKTKVINKKVFENCKSLKTITIPKKVRKIDVTAFKGCENLKEIIIDSKSKNLYRDTELDKKTYSHKKVSIYLDDIFAYAEKIYIKKVPKFNVFKGAFKKITSDKAKYSLYVRV